jgi:hypothetical protein
MINPSAAGRPGFDESPERRFQAIGRQSALISSCLISWVGSRGRRKQETRRLGDVQRRRKFHGPTPSMRWGVILVMYPGGGSGIAGKMTSGPR